jgi:stearoyl-CoA desaturase (delta-9 desaturase)
LPPSAVAAPEPETFAPPAADQPTTEDLPPPTPAARVATVAAITLPLLGTVAAMASVWGWGFTWADFGLLTGAYLVTGLGITVGFHRLFSHKSFETGKSLELLWGVLGSMAIQGPLLRWVAMHRLHHHYSDKDRDPHSPNGHGAGVGGVLRGLWHAHVGWAFGPDPIPVERYVTDLRKRVLPRAIDALFPLWVVIGLVIPATLGGLFTLSWGGVVRGLLWGGFVRVFLVHHITWSVNSVCHLWGSRPYPEKDSSRNNVLFGVLALGEGWHNNHHAFPTSARHGLRWWQVDPSYMVIWAMEKLGLAWKVRLPAARPAVA